ncbi:uncharacterized protein LOC130453026 [Diorhabda sublineata]|uniref:uncharacterized protein LOC130453026 n=1 Tax=Diorhabda sublineata TaxID=1163346 RepID=UPI0024E115BE|nr:uncharacterized protein LOC130453026 [Diorhabda sublineata]
MVKLRSKHSLSEQIGSPEVETVNISIPSTSKLICEEILPVSSSKLIIPEQNMQSQVMMCTPTKISSLNKATRLLSSIGVRKASELTPKAKKLYRVASSLRKISKKLNFGHTSLKKRIRVLEKVSYTAEVLKTKVNKTTYDFIMSQVRCQGVKPKGRRYSLDEKIFFLSLLKQSPKGYKLIRKIFAAPSRKTLTNLLGKIPFNMGINPAIMDSLAVQKKTCQKWINIAALCLMKWP